MPGAVDGLDAQLVQWRVIQAQQAHLRAGHKLRCFHDAAQQTIVIQQHGYALADAVQRVEFAQARFQRPIGLQQPRQQIIAFFADARFHQRVLDGLDHDADFEGLGYIVAHAQVKGFDRHLFGAVRGGHDDRNGQAAIFQRAQDLHAVQLGQFHVEDDQIGVVFLRQLARLPGR